MLRCSSGCTACIAECCADWCPGKRKCCLAFCLTQQERSIIFRADEFFHMINIDKDCCRQEHLSQAEMAALTAVLQKTLWGADDFVSALSSLVSDTASRADGWDLVKRIVETVSYTHLTLPTICSV